MSARDALLLVTTSYPRWANGREAAGSFVADFAEELSHSVKVRVVAPGDRATVEHVSGRLTVYRYAAPMQRLVNLRIWNPFAAIRILLTLIRGRAAIKRATADGEVRHILALWALPCGWWARSAADRHRIHYSVWMLGSDIWMLGKIPIVRSILRVVMRGARHRYADGLLLADESARICGSSVGFLPSTRKLESEAVEPPAERSPYRLVFIGRWHSNKGVDLLLDALLMLQGADWTLIREVAIYGGGPLHPRVHERVAALRAAGRPLSVGGFIPKSEAEQAIMRADYVLIPSRVESIPVVFSDAMKLQRPVVATPVGDFPALHAQYPFGILAAETTAPALRDALGQALSTSTRLFEAGVAAHGRRFDLNQIANQFLGDISAHE